MRNRSLIFILTLLAVIPITSVHGEEHPKTERVIFYMDAIATPENITFELVLRNDTKTPINLEFASSQLYEIMVHDNTNQQKYQFSKGKSFAQVLKTIDLQPGKEISWHETWKEHGLPKGEYQVSAGLKTVRINHVASEPLSTTRTVMVPAENPAFKKIEVSGENGLYRVKGQAKSKNGTFYYTVEDGHHQQIQETKKVISEDTTEWSIFVLELKIPEDDLPQNGTLLLNLYERENEMIVHNYSVVLEKFY
jgi:Intracellular proteinase inhibitor